MAYVVSKRYNERDILDYFVSNFVKAHFNKWDYGKYGGRCNSSENYTKRNGESIRVNFNYHFRNDCVSISNDFGNSKISFNDEADQFEEYL